MRRMTHCLPPLGALVLFLLIWSRERSYDSGNHRVRAPPPQPPQDNFFGTPPPLLPSVTTTSVAANTTPAGPVEQCSGDCVCDPISGGASAAHAPLLFRIARFHTTKVCLVLCLHSGADDGATARPRPAIILTAARWCMAAWLAPRPV